MRPQPTREQADAAVSSNIFPATDAPLYVRGNSVCAPAVSADHADCSGMAFAVMAIGLSALLTVTNLRENRRRDAQYGPVTPEDSTAEALLKPEAMRRFGTEGLTREEVLDLGDRHRASDLLWVR